MTQEKPIWRDETTYSRDDKDRNPSIWNLYAGNLKITVHRHIHYAPDIWLLSCSDFYDKYELPDKDVEKAKKRAISLVSEKVEKMYEIILTLEGKKEIIK
jgi:hypothetical protein